MAKPHSIPEQKCTACGAKTLLAFAGLEYPVEVNGVIEKKILNLCGSCAKNLCRMALDWCHTSYLLTTLHRFSKHQ